MCLETKEKRGVVVNRSRSKKWRPSRRRRRGAVAVEFAILVMLFVVIMLGILEFGRAIQVQQVITNAAREAARRAIVPGATDQQIQNVVNRYMVAAGIRGHNVVVQVNGAQTNLAGATSHDAISVSVSVPYSQVRWIATNWIANDANLEATVVTRRE